MNVSALPGLIPAIASTTVYVALTIIVAGISSALVALGALQAFGRERIQRRVLWSFFASPDAVPVDFAGAPSGARAFVAARLLGIPEKVLCRLYYRQITGQFLAAANSEATGSRRAGPGLSVLDALSAKPQIEEKGDPASRLQVASQRIDILQARLGDAVLQAVFRLLAAGWFAVYLSAALATVSGFYRIGRAQGAVADGFIAVWSFWAPYIAGSLLLAGGLALSSAAAGVVAFGWLDRFSAPK